MRPVMLLVFLLAALRLSGQGTEGYTFQHLDQTDGLLHNNVLGVEQDARGFIWIITPNGLQRFDGSRFVNYRGIINDAALGRTDGGDIWFDAGKNVLWVRRGSLVEKLSIETNRFARFDAASLGRDSSNRFEIYTDASGGRWQVGDRGMLPLDDQGNLLRYVDIHPATVHKTAVLIHDNDPDRLWMTQGRMLVLFDRRSHRIFTSEDRLPMDPLLRQVARMHIPSRYCMTDKRSNVWITTWGNFFYRFDRSTGQLHTYDLAAIAGRSHPSAVADDFSVLINAMLEDDHGNLWVATENAGLLLYDPEKDVFSSVTVDAKNGNGIRYNFKILSLFQDKDENIWLGTDMGISIFSPYRQFFHFTEHADHRPSVPGIELLAVTQDTTGDILAGTWGGGISIYDSQWQFKRTVVLPGSSIHNMIWCFQPRKDGTVWAGGQEGWLHTYDPAGGTTVSRQPPEMKQSTIRCMTEDVAGNLWFGLQNGRVTEWNKADNRFYASTDSTDAKTGRPASVYRLFIDPAGRYWAGTNGGFKEFDPVQRRFVRTFLPAPADSHAVSGITCQGIEALNDSILLIGTVHGGLDFFNTHTGRFSPMISETGLPVNTVYAIRKDAGGFVWFTTDYGLYKFRPGTKELIRYSMTQGTINSPFASNLFFRFRDGSWATNTSTEILHFSPLKDTAARFPEELAITGFRVLDSMVFIDSFLYRRAPVVLNAGQNFVTIQYSLLNYSRVRQTRFFYRLTGVNKDWVAAGTRTFANYTNLDPGTYLFTVRSEGATGTTRFNTLEIVILPAVWQTWWFRALCLLLLLLGVLYIFRRRVRMIRTESDLKEKVLETKMIALRAQMNPHFIFNCLNSIDNLIQMDEKEKATKYLSKFARLIRSTLENSNKYTVPVWKDMESLQLYLELESLRFDNKFSYHFTIAKEISQGDYKVPPLIIQPFVENAIHHGLLNKIGEDKQLRVDVSVTNNHIRFVIEDNGVGRAKAVEYKVYNGRQHESMGLQITTDRINLFNHTPGESVVITDLLDNDHQPCGTKVLVELINLS